MLFLESFKDYFNKSDFDFSATDIDLFKFHPQIRVLLALNGIFFNNRESLLRFLWPFVCVSLTFVGTIFEMMQVGHALSIDDFSLATESFAYQLTIFTVIIQYPCTLRGRQKLYEILKKMGEDFQSISKLDQQYRDTFLSGHLKIWKMGVLWFTFLMCIAVVYCLMPMVELLYMSLFATVDEHMVRPLFFPLWLPKDDPYRTPNYEIFLTVEVIMMFVVILTFGGYIYFNFHVLLHILIQMDMMEISIGSLFDGLDERVAYLDKHHEDRKQVQRILNKRIGEIVEWHIDTYSYARTITSVYGPVLMYQTLCSSMAICLMAYQVADQLGRGIFDIRFALMWVGSWMQLLIPCYLGSLLESKSFSLGEICYQNGWHEKKLTQLVYVDMCLVIMRSQTPISLRVTGAPAPSLQTFSSIISTAYTYFNLLRQMKEGM